MKLLNVDIGKSCRHDISFAWMTGYHFVNIKQSFHLKKKQYVRGCMYVCNVYMYACIWKNRKESSQDGSESSCVFHVLEVVAERKTQEMELNVSKLKILQYSLGVTRMDRIRNEYIRETVEVGRHGGRVRGKIEIV